MKKKDSSKEVLRKNRGNKKYPYDIFKGVNLGVDKKEFNSLKKRVEILEKKIN